ncbi:hypothetical protein [Rhodococcus koreensis]
MLAVRFWNDLPQPLDEPMGCHSKLDKNFRLGSASVRRPHAGKLDETLCLGVGMFALAIAFDPSCTTFLVCTTLLAPLAILTSVHGIYAPAKTELVSKLCLIAVMRPTCRVTVSYPLRGK